jgi:hypothetical protein
MRPEPTLTSDELEHAVDNHAAAGGAKQLAEIRTT